MKDEGVIGEKQYVVKPEALGFDVNIFCLVRMKEHSRDKLIAFETTVARGATGGVLAIAGDDDTCKSSSIPHQSDHAFIAALVPMLYPSSLQEFIEYGL